MYRTTRRASAAFFATIILLGVQTAAIAGASQGGRSGLQGASYLTAYNHQKSNIQPLAGTGGVKSDDKPSDPLPAPSSLLLFATALTLVGGASWVRRNNRRRG